MGVGEMAQLKGEASLTRGGSYTVDIRIGFRIYLEIMLV